MLSKHVKPWKKEVLGPAYQLGRQIEDICSGNQISATQAQDMMNSAVDAGIDELSSKRKRTSSKNAARAWKTSRKSKTFWPAHYTFSAPLWDAKKKNLVQGDVSIWLPLELMDMIHKLGDAKVIGDLTMMDPTTKAHLQKERDERGLPNLQGIGLHADGIPNNYDRTESCFGMTINLPGLGGEWSRMRIPIMVGPSAKITPESMDAILAVVAWSIRHLLLGQHPTCRHDGSEWDMDMGDRARSKKTGPLGFNATLVEVRGDWDWYSKIFHFPYHSELAGICWKCSCKKHEASSPNCSIDLWKQ
jgi:hypothetical protein